MPGLLFAADVIMQRVEIVARIVEQRVLRFVAMERLDAAVIGGGLQVIPDQSQLRQRIAQDLGIVLPKVTIRDSLRLKDRAYRLKLRGVAIASGEVQPDKLFAIDTGATSGVLAGVESKRADEAAR